MTGAAPAAGALLARIGFGRGRVDLVGIEADLVIDLALLFVAQNIVGLGDLFELLLGPLIVGIHVRVVLARGLAEGLADLLRRGRLLDAERCVIVFVGGGGHGYLNSIFSLICRTSAILRFKMLVILSNKKSMSS